MRGLFEVFRLEWRALTRSKTFLMLLVAGIVWMFALPYLMRGDGTAEGFRELYVRYSLGGVFTLLIVSLLSSATGSLARERAAKRLQLTRVRPVRYTLIVLGKIAAHVAVGAIVLTVAGGVLAFKVGCAAPCFHVLSPVLPSPREEATAMYEHYMKDPETPEAVKKTKKEIVLRLLENRARDRYEVIRTNATARWRFPIEIRSSEGLKVRMRFTNPYEMRQDVVGEFRVNGGGGIVSNITQTVIEVPLERRRTELPKNELRFDNRGRAAVMFRPRKDINLLLPADAFGWNLLRTTVALTAILTLVISFGIFLSAGLGRPVALFVAFVTLIVGEMSPSVVAQYPDELETRLVDRIGLHITRFAAEVTRPVSAASPIEALSNGECVETRSVVRLLLADAIAVPLVLSLLSAFALGRKQEE